MEKITEVIKDLEGLRHLTPAPLEEVQKAEKELGLSFADDYKEYVLNYGVISAKRIELTGITSAKRLDVVSVTKEERELSHIPAEMYVIENMAIEGMLVLQSGTGEIYSISSGQKPEKIYSSLAEYILCK